MAGQNFWLHEVSFGSVGIHPNKIVMFCSQGGYGGRQLTLLVPTNNAIKKAAEANREKRLVKLHPGYPDIAILQRAILLQNIAW
jgi:hypothetical protein